MGAIELNSTPVSDQGLRGFLNLLQRSAQVVVERSLLRNQGHGLLQSADPVAHPARLAIGDAQAAPGVSILGCLLDCLAEQFDGPRGISGPERLEALVACTHYY